MTLQEGSRPKSYVNETVERIQVLLNTNKTVAGIIGVVGVGSILTMCALAKVGDTRLREHNEYLRLAAEVERTEKETLEKKVTYDTAKKAEEIARAALQGYLEGLKKKYEKKNGVAKKADPQ